MHVRGFSSLPYLHSGERKKKYLYSANRTSSFKHFSNSTKNTVSKYSCTPVYRDTGKPRHEISQCNSASIPLCTSRTVFAGVRVNDGMNFSRRCNIPGRPQRTAMHELHGICRSTGKPRYELFAAVQYTRTDAAYLYARVARYLPEYPSAKV